MSCPVPSTEEYSTPLESSVLGFPVHRCVAAVVGHIDWLGWAGMEKAQKVKSQRSDP